MVRLTRTATRQVEALIEHYVRLERDGAIRNLQRAVRDALALIEADPNRGSSHPRPYPMVASWGYRWVKMHRYWFGYSTADDDLVVTNVLYDAVDLPGRVAEMGSPHGLLKTAR